MFSTYDSLPGGGGPGEVGGVPEFAATKEDCDGRPWRLTYDLRPYESIIVEIPEGKIADEPGEGAEGAEGAGIAEGA